MEHFHPKITNRTELRQLIDETTCIKYKAINDNPRRIIAIGDLHGDFEQLFIILNTLGIIDKDNNWTGNDTILVQTGDVLDDGGRGNDTDKSEYSGDEFAIYHLLINLHKQANKVKGAVLMCIGNHEILNILDNNFNYVNKYTQQYFNNILHTNRKNIISVGSPMAKSLSCVLKSVIRINNIYFCHGGLSYKCYQSIIKSNKWKSLDDFFDHINSVLPKILNGNIQKYNEEMQYIYDIAWDRSLSGDTYNKTLICNHFNEMFPNDKKLIIGHSIQMQGINTICNNNVYRIDTGISRAFNIKNKLEVLEIINCTDFYRVIINDNKIKRIKIL